jgi:AGCS family alanine or glycine:cation symporter
LKRAILKKGAFQSLCLSLAGTLGIGNIIGVTFGISVGGAGSVFWLFLSSIFSLVIKFSEACLSSDMKLSRGGMTEAIEKSFKSKAPAYFYAILCLALSLTMGAALQSRSAVESLTHGDKILIPSIAFAFLVALAILGGAKRIEKISTYIIPLATLIYIALTLFVLTLNFSRLPSVLSAIIRDAFKLDSAFGGVGAFAIISKMREGFARGLLSNEAGAGTSAFAHARNSSSPVSVGLIGMCEVLFDTVFLCMLTALAVLLAVPSPESYASGLEIIKAALSSLGFAASPILSASIFAFAFSTVICWYYYGVCALSYLTEKCRYVFAFLFIGAVFWGSLTKLSSLIVLSDYLLFFLSLISLTTIIKNSDRLVYLSENEGLLKKSDS